MLRNRLRGTLVRHTSPEAGARLRARADADKAHPAIRWIYRQWWVYAGGAGGLLGGHLQAGPAENAEFDIPVGTVFAVIAVCLLANLVRERRR